MYDRASTLATAFGAKQHTRSPAGKQGEDASRIPLPSAVHSTLFDFYPRHASPHNAIRHMPPLAIAIAIASSLHMFVTFFAPSRSSLVNPACVPQATKAPSLHGQILVPYPPRAKGLRGNRHAGIDRPLRRTPSPPSALPHVCRALHHPHPSTHPSLGITTTTKSDRAVPRLTTHPSPMECKRQGNSQPELAPMRSNGEKGARRTAGRSMAGGVDSPPRSHEIGRVREPAELLLHRLREDCVTPIVSILSNIRPTKTNPKEYTGGTAGEKGAYRTARASTPA